MICGKILRLVGLLIVVFWGEGVFAVESVSCGSALEQKNYPGVAEAQYVQVDGYKIQYTLILPERAASERFSGHIIHYFHSALSDARRVNTSKFIKKFFEKVQQEGHEKPALLTVSLGKFWMLESPRSNIYRSSISVEIIKKAMDAIYSRHNLVPTRTSGLGGSMGAFNLFQFVVKFPKFFEKIALIALPTIPSFVGGAEARSEHLHVMRANIVDRSKGKSLGWLPKIGTTLFSRFIEHLFLTERDWQANNPLDQLARLEAGVALPPMLVSVGAKDELGYFRGNEAFVRELERRGVPVEWIPAESGGHGGPYPVEEIFDFILLP